MRSLLRALGVEGLIRSPTYTLVEAYQPRGFSCIHVDLYRLQGPVDVEELGLRDFLDTDCLLLVEWPEKGGPALPPADIDLTLTYAYPHGGDMAWGTGPEGEAWGTGPEGEAVGNPDGAACRRARLEARSVGGRRWLNMLLHDTSLTPYLSNST
ncbi:MAG: tRNA (adenosine(37)-N6)-threonylcarbamoyltransferase complex ATPase subunit type 1 TsaE [Pseudomonadota bacterium]|nr:tRNA (adenosine(37)-N6)-threonylcarbamoyltransferase complex ATPase subunit type 1 TsaE [Pseudomonadota bacterium]